MGRERNFSEAQVIDQAANVFSTHGYNGTSVNMLAQATGLGKQSLYNSFGDKQTLYLQAVDCAVARYATITQIMQAAPNGRAALTAFFERIVQDCSDADPAVQSCIVSAGLLEAIEDAAIQMTLQKKWQSTHELLRSAVERGQRDGSVQSRLPSAQLADVFMSVMSGLRVAARVDAAPRRLKGITQSTLMLLDQP
jgi:TetR/AcrR family transcriptional regulator, transcriptional repressor for nem operon